VTINGTASFPTPRNAMVYQRSNSTVQTGGSITPVWDTLLINNGSPPITYSAGTFTFTAACTAIVTWDLHVNTIVANTDNLWTFKINGVNVRRYGFTYRCGSATGYVDAGPTFVRKFATNDYFACDAFCSNGNNIDTNNTVTIVIL
jgi:hypothetical protein